ncbi:short transient receptor potential channel 4-like [Asterias rubens]|uniref:short transient receptor potential channel 4-like n=1 Tax=Asterias rubens TaxID=7604 RepID=UPI0014554CC0|nr:short transient receptor potential channel 4-like [Asterias rubens]
MDNEAFELESKKEKGLPSNGHAFLPNGNLGGNEEEAIGMPSSPGVENSEDGRYELVRGVADSGNGQKLDELLTEWAELGWIRDWRNEEGLTLYADAITDGYMDVINTLLHHDIPLGDALLRAIDAELGEAIQAICDYIQPHQDISESTLNGNCDNDDFHPAVTPLVLAAQRNDFNTVQLLVGIGGKLEEPRLAQGGDMTLTQATSYLQIYRALSQPAFILATQVDIFGHLFQLSHKLRTLSQLWEDFGAKYDEMASDVDAFAGEMLGQSSSTEEILALFRFHNTNKYRNKEGAQHPLSKMFEAIKYQQKQFIAHPHSQKAIIAQFYQNLLSWNEKGVLHQILLALLVILGYPIICLLYIIFPVSKVVNFARLPYVKMLMKMGSGLTFLAFILAASVLDRNRYKATFWALHWFILIWAIGKSLFFCATGLMWSHMKVISTKGIVKHLSDSANIQDAFVLALFFVVFFLRWNGRLIIAPNVALRPRRAAVNGTFLNSPSYIELQDHVNLALSSLHGKLAGTTVEGVGEIAMKVLSSCWLDPTETTVVPLTTSSSEFNSYLQDHVEFDSYHPEIIAEGLFGIVITVSFLRLMNVLLVSEAIGPLRISFGAMAGDVGKFLILFSVVWFAFSIGLSQVHHSAVLWTERKCRENENDPCERTVGFATLFVSLFDLYWTLFGIVEKDSVRLPPGFQLQETIGTLMFAAYHVVGVLVLLNALIGMLSNTYMKVEQNADTEWKFNRTVVWGAYLHPLDTLPPPFNLIPSIKNVIRFLRDIVGMWLKCARRKRVNRHVLHQIRSRYIQGNLSVASTNSDSIRPRDVQLLRNDIQALRHFAEIRLETIDKSLDTSNGKASGLRKKLEDLGPLGSHVTEVLSKSVALTDNADSLRAQTDQLEEEQATEIVDRDHESADLRDRIAEQISAMEQLRSDHAAEVREMDRHAESLNGIIRRLNDEVVARERHESALANNIIRLEGEKTSLGLELDDVNEEKTKLGVEVARLTGQLQHSRLGFMQRVATVIEDRVKAPGDQGEGPSN